MDSGDHGDCTEYPPEFAFHQRQDIVTSRDLSACIKNIAVMGQQLQISVIYSILAHLPLILQISRLSKPLQVSDGITFQR